MEKNPSSRIQYSDIGLNIHCLVLSKLPNLPLQLQKQLWLYTLSIIHYHNMNLPLNLPQPNLHLIICDVLTKAV